MWDVGSNGKDDNELVTPDEEKWIVDNYPDLMGTITALIGDDIDEEEQEVVEPVLWERGFLLVGLGLGLFNIKESKELDLFLKLCCTTIKENLDQFDKQYLDGDKGS